LHPFGEVYPSAAGLVADFGGVGDPERSQEGGAGAVDGLVDFGAEALEGVDGGLGVAGGVGVALKEGASELSDGIAIVFEIVLVGDEDKLVVDGDAPVLGADNVDIVALIFHSDGFVGPVAADTGIDLLCHQSCAEVKANVHKLDVLEALEAVGFEHGVEEGFVGGDAGIADLLAFELAGLGDAGGLEGHDGVQRPLDNGGDGDDGYTSVSGKEEVGLVGDAEVVSAGADGDEDGCRVGGGIGLDVQAFVVEVAFVEGDEEAGVVGVGEPVKGEADFLGGVGAGVAAGGEGEE